MAKKKITLVKKVDIGGVMCKVYYVKQFSKKIQQELGGDCVAYCDWAKRNLWLRYDVARTDDLTLVHEITHACVEAITDNSAYQREWFVKSLSQLIYGAIKSMGRPLR